MKERVKLSEEVLGAADCQTTKRNFTYCGTRFVCREVPRSRGSNRCSAFTLVELLVVISIIALLLAMLMPALQKAQSQAKKVVCASRMRNWGLATALYEADWNGQFPWYADTYPNGPIQTVYYNTLAHYLGGLDMKTTDVAYDATDTANSQIKVRQCPECKNSVGWIGPVFCIYNIPGQLYTAPFVWRIPGQGPIAKNEPVKVTRVRQPSTWATFIDCYNWGFYSPAWLKFDYDSDKDGIKDTNRGDYYTDHIPYNWAMPKIHGGTGCNMTAFDGHVEFLPFKQFLTRKWSD